MKKWKLLHDWFCLFILVFRNAVNKEICATRYKFLTLQRYRWPKHRDEQTSSRWNFCVMRQYIEKKLPCSYISLSVLWLECGKRYTPMYQTVLGFDGWWHTYSMCMKFNACCGELKKLYFICNPTFNQVQLFSNKSM